MGRFRLYSPQGINQCLASTAFSLPGATLFDLGGLQVGLEGLLGVHVDLLTLGDLPPHFRNKVLEEAQPV